MMEVKKVTCFVCDWSTSSKVLIDHANFYGECLYCQGEETLLRWDYVDGSILIVNTESGDRVEMMVQK